MRAAAIVTINGETDDEQEWHLRYRVDLRTGESGARFDGRSRSPYDIEFVGDGSWLTEDADGRHVRWLTYAMEGLGLPPASMSLTLLNTLWLVGFVLIEVNLVLAALRAGRGLTLDVWGITWHGSEVFLPWSNVESVQVGTDLKRQNARAEADVRLVVRAVEPTQASDGQRGMARLGIQANMQRFGGPIALEVAKLSVPASDVIAAADRLKAEYFEADSFSASADGPPWARRERALRVMNVWSRLGLAGLLTGLATIFLTR